MAVNPKDVDVNSVPWKSNEEFFRETGTNLDDYAPIDWEAHVDWLIAIAKWIPPYKLTILTGSNASGKSVIRKLMQRAIADRLGLEPDKPCVASLSFMTRAGLDSFRGINFLRDTEWSATSTNSIRLAKGVLKSKDRFIILDEPEIGMGEEMQLAFAQYINSIKKDVLERSHGLLVITHSRIIVKELENDAFVNIDHRCYTKQDWLNRDIVPTDFDQFEKRSDALFKAIGGRENKFKESQKET